MGAPSDETRTQERDQVAHALTRAFRVIALASGGRRWGHRPFSHALTLALWVITLGRRAQNCIACCGWWPFSHALMPALWVMTLGSRRWGRRPFSHALTLALWVITLGRRARTRIACRGCRPFSHAPMPALRGITLGSRRQDSGAHA